MLLLIYSWGPRWGDGGYFKVARSKRNNCGVSQQGYYPILPNQVETKDMRDKLKETCFESDCEGSDTSTTEKAAKS